MKKLEKKYNFAESEKKWQDYWEENGIYHFDWNDTGKKMVFIILIGMIQREIIYFQ